MPVSPAPVDPAATVIVLRSVSDRFEVLMVRRPDRGAFGGLVVFPGGKLEPVDFSELASSVVISEQRDRAFRCAGLRELAEETGLLLTDDGLRSLPSLHGEELLESVRARGMRIPADQLVLVSRWVTPEVSRRRFDTRFYLLGATESPQVKLDHAELTGFDWVTPETALGRYKTGEWPMILPTISHLRWLSMRSSIDDAQASALGADGETVIAPRMTEDGTLVRIYKSSEEM